MPSDNIFYAFKHLDIVSPLTFNKSLKSLHAADALKFPESQRPFHCLIIVISLISPEHPSASSSAL